MRAKSLSYLIIGCLIALFYCNPLVYAINGENEYSFNNDSFIQRGPIPGLNNSTSYCFFYGKLNDCIINEIIRKFKLVILHPGVKEPLITPAQVTSLKAAGVIVIGYIPFGEDYEMRPGDGTGPVYFDEQNCCLIHENKGWASFYVDDEDHNGIPDKNLNFNSFFINAGDLNWHNFIKTATIASDRFAGTDYILNYIGCNGLFIDVIETANPWLPYHYSWRGMFDLLDKISNLYPDKYMVVNRPLFACNPNYYPMSSCNNNPDSCTNPKFCFCDFSSHNEAKKKFRQNINAFVWESYSLDRAYLDFPITLENVKECSDNSDSCGFTMLVLDYYNLIKDHYPCMDHQIKEVRDLGWLDYIAPGPLYQIGYWVYNYLNNLCYPLIDGYFNEWLPSKVSYCRSDSPGNISKEDADIIHISITHDPDYLYFKIKCKGTIPKDFYPNFYQIFISSDTGSPGYKGPTANWVSEYNWMWENGKLYKYTGSGSDWSWEMINEAGSLSSYSLGIDDGASMEIAISRCIIGAETQKDVKAIFNVNAFDIEQSDNAPDDPSQDYYLYKIKPIILIDGDMEDWGNLPAGCGNTACKNIDILGDTTDCSADIVNTWICSDLTNIYFKIQFACPLPQPLWGEKFTQIFIDADRDSSTGYTSCNWEIGAEYLFENGHFYKHTGTNCNWSWKWVSTTSYAIGLSDNSQIEISIPYSSLSFPSYNYFLCKEKPMRYIFRVVNNMGEILDAAPDSLEINFYQWPASTMTYYLDSDKDGFGDPSKGITACSVPNIYVANAEDCDDSDNTIYPGADEICDRKDNNCDGLIPSNELDPDNDGIITCEDNCPDDYNPSQLDTDEDNIGDACDPCDNSPITGSLFPSIEILWPPDHRMVPVTINTSRLETHNPDTQIKITSVIITESSSQEADDTYGENLYSEENNFEPDFEITDDLTINLRSERTGKSQGRIYTIIVTASDCSGDYIFNTDVIVPHDKRK
jgi:hypothetical protein